MGTIFLQKLVYNEEVVQARDGDGVKPRASRNKCNTRPKFKLRNVRQRFTLGLIELMNINMPGNTANHFQFYSKYRY